MTATDTVQGQRAHDGGLLRGHEPGLDGLRAISIGFVLAYHGGLGWARGGFLGISVFFALSGFLVATVLLRADRGGGIRPTAFWARRVRRLFPASTAALLVAGIYGATVATREQADALPGQALAAAANVANWRFLADGTSYAARFEAPSPVLHYWSLSVEEQFYLVAPLALAAALGSARLHRHLGLLSGALAVAAVGWGAWLHRGGASLDRLYYGTDVRAGEILVGVTAAVVLDRAGRGWVERHRRTLGLAGALALGGLVALAATTELSDGFLWRGGFALCAVLTVLAVTGSLAGTGPLRALAWAPVTAMGRVSYGIYLFHFPVFLWLTPERVDLGRPALFGLRVAVTLALAATSYHLLEMPVRRGWTPPVPRRWVAATVPGAALVAVAIVAGAAATNTSTTQSVLGPTAGSASAPTAAGPDATFDVLVIGDELGERTLGALEQELADDRQVRIVAGPTFSCDGPASSGDAVICRSWLDEWAPAVDDAGADLVLLLVADWSAADVEAALGPGAAGDLPATLHAGVDLLVAEGATTLWAPPGRLLLAEPSPFDVAMQSLLTSRPDVRTVAGMPRADADAYPAVAAAVLAARVRELSSTDAGPTRIMLVGDSQIASLSVGLERWAATTGSATVWSAARHGCPLLLDGEIRGADGQIVELGAACRARDRSWSAAVERFQPHLVVVQAGLDDLADRRIDTAGPFVGPGDPAFDEAVATSYAELVATLTTGGARVVWLTSPCVGNVEIFPGAGPQFDDDPARPAALNEAIAGLVAERAPTVALVDLAAILCPGGEPLAALEGIGDVRPDGVHLSEAASEWVAGIVGPQLAALAEP